LIVLRYSRLCALPVLYHSEALVPSTSRSLYSTSTAQRINIVREISPTEIGREESMTKGNMGLHFAIFKTRRRTFEGPWKYVVPRYKTWL
jgi:hypothetical protein